MALKNQNSFGEITLFITLVVDLFMSHLEEFSVEIILLSLVLCE